MKEKLERIRAEKGFTLAELLVVILIIAILATLAIVFFGGQQTTAQEGVAKANIRSAFSSAAGYYATSGGGYPGADDAARQSALISVMNSDGVNTSSLATAATAAPTAPAIGVNVNTAASVTTVTFKNRAGSKTCTATTTGNSLSAITCS